jgi:hypothetical protein
VRKAPTVREICIEAVATSPGAIANGQPVLEDLGFAATALETLCERTGCDTPGLQLGNGWAAEVRVDGTRLLLCSTDGERWSILAPPGVDESDAAFAARTLHGVLGGKAEESDLDR